MTSILFNKDSLLDVEGSMLRRWARGVLVTVIVSFVVVSAVGSAAAPLTALLPSGLLSADLGAVRIELTI